MLESELLTIDGDGVGVDFSEVHDDHGVRLHRAVGPLTGPLEVGYQATVVGTIPAPLVTDIDLIRLHAAEAFIDGGLPFDNWSLPMRLS